MDSSGISTSAAGLSASCWATRNPSPLASPPLSPGTPPLPSQHRERRRRKAPVRWPPTTSASPGPNALVPSPPSTSGDRSQHKERPQPNTSAPPSQQKRRPGLTAPAGPLQHRGHPGPGVPAQRAPPMPTPQPPQQSPRARPVTPDAAAAAAPLSDRRAPTAPAAVARSAVSGWTDSEGHPATKRSSGFSWADEFDDLRRNGLGFGGQMLDSGSIGVRGLGNRKLLMVGEESWDREELLLTLLMVE
ncbi:hypothetical protein C8A03DRAFT_31556 [Achaetomium macrosporum]|uniref:Uncharacterized protein n=1 Tax=Achaetomium macrosporum TaxID=79813 RepID=A0AAN7CE71_9PEZI|nr:hypothetical protein C8A03DRAFT_31556 [Achaetomium macrosporum]